MSVLREVRSCKSKGVGLGECCRVEVVGFGKWCWVKRVGERENLEFKGI